MLNYTKNLMNWV